jgi:chemotaxis protein MotA
MFAIIGIVVVFCAVIGGFLMEKGHMAVLLQPAELLIIAGAATGTLLTANPLHIIKEIAGALSGVIKGSPFVKARYLSTLRMMYQFLNKVRKEGLLSVEMDVEKPSESSIFKNYPEFLNDHHARDFVCDTLRTAITGGVEPFDMDQMMELDMEVHHHAATQPVRHSLQWPTRSRALESWLQCSAWSSPWVRSAARLSRSEKRLPLRWSARFSAFSSAMASSDRWHPT